MKLASCPWFKRLAGGFGHTFFCGLLAKKACSLYPFLYSSMQIILHCLASTKLVSCMSLTPNGAAFLNAKLVLKVICGLTHKFYSWDKLLTALSQIFPRQFVCGNYFMWLFSTQTCGWFWHLLTRPGLAHNLCMIEKQGTTSMWRKNFLLHPQKELWACRQDIHSQSLAVACISVCLSVGHHSRGFLQKV